MSSTRSSPRSSSSSHMRATTSGWEIVCPEPIGSATLSHASSRRRAGTKRRAARRGSPRARAGRRRACAAPRAGAASGPSPGCRLRHARTGGPQLLERPLGVARLDVHAPHRRRVDAHGEPLAQRVARGVEDAVVRGEPDDRELVDAAPAQALREPGRRRSPSSRRCRGPGPCRRSRRSARCRGRGAAPRPRVPCDAVRRATGRPAPRRSRGRAGASRASRARGRSRPRRRAR